MKALLWSLVALVLSISYPALSWAGARPDTAVAFMAACSLSYRAVWPLWTSAVPLVLGRYVLAGPDGRSEAAALLCLTGVLGICVYQRRPIGKLGVCAVACLSYLLVLGFVALWARGTGRVVPLGTFGAVLRAGLLTVLLAAGFREILREGATGP